ncbi:Glutamate--tRNA ligase [uncultured archaeon]|nr:Glutamate--tRNA ligase [uncultured archaeon]
MYFYMAKVKSSELQTEIRKIALLNAISFGGKANPKAVAGKVLGSIPEARKDVPATMKLIEEACSQINSMPVEEQNAQVSKLKISIPEKEETVEKKALPPLEGALAGKVVMRMAPNPNGPLHIGHSRMAILNDEYAKMYDGKLILRFDDSDPKNKNKLPMKEAYAWIEEDLKWLGVKYDGVERVSARIPAYYKYFEKLLEMNGAYICTCKQEEWSETARKKRKLCPCRSLSVSENMKRWKMMLDWKYKQGEAVARIKTDLSEKNHLADSSKLFSPDILSMAKNPAVIDWVAFRIIDEPEHPMADKSVKVWPMLDFASAIDDFEFKITHIIRGKDLAVSELRQKVLYSYFGWKYPKTRVYGKFVTTEDMVVSKSKINEGIRQGKYSGFDDPQLATIMAFRRRGIRPAAIREYILSLGVSESETTFDMNILESINRKIVDPKAARYFFVDAPVKLKLTPKAGGIFKIRKHPQHPEMGERTLKLAQEIYVSKSDAKPGEEVMLMGAMLPVKITGKEIELLKFTSSKRFIHWLPADEKEIVQAEVRMPDGTTKKGVLEKAALSEGVGAIIQLERFGFARIDALQNKANKQVLLYYTHK